MNSLGRGADGSRAALPIWIDVMRAALEERPRRDFAMPSGVVTATIDPASVDTNYPADDKDFDAEIASDMFLNAAKFPEITFVSKSIELTGDNTGTVTGDLTLNGQTREETLDVTFNTALNPHPMSQKPAVGFSGAMTVDRTEYGIEALAGPVAAEVLLEIEAEFVPQS